MMLISTVRMADLKQSIHALNVITIGGIDMFLFWVAIAITIGVGESLKDSYDAYKYKTSGEEERALRRIRGEKY